MGSWLVYGLASVLYTATSPCPSQACLQIQMVGGWQDCSNGSPPATIHFNHQQLPASGQWLQSKITQLLRRRRTCRNNKSHQFCRPSTNCLHITRRAGSKKGLNDVISKRTVRPEQFCRCSFFAPWRSRSRLLGLVEGKTSPCPRVPACHTLHEIYRPNYLV